jgi:hypothetical protein
MLQKAWYEVFPAVFLFMSIYVLNGDNRQAAFFGFILFVVATSIIMMRIQWRSKIRAKRNHENHFRKLIG